MNLTSSVNKMIDFTELKGEMVVIPDGIYGTLSFSFTVAKTIYVFAHLFCFDEDPDFLMIHSGVKHRKPTMYPSFDYVESKFVEYPDLMNEMEISIMTQMEEGGLSISTQANCGDHNRKLIELCDSRRMQIIVLIVFIIQNYYPDIQDKRILALFDTLSLSKKAVDLIGVMKSSKPQKIYRKSINSRKLSEKEVQDVGNLMYPAWREVEAQRRVSDLSINFVCPSFPIFSDTLMSRSDELIHLFDTVRPIPDHIPSTDIDGITFDLMFSLHAMHVKLQMANCAVVQKNFHFYTEQNNTRLFIHDDKGFIFEHTTTMSPMLTGFDDVIFGPDSRKIHGHRHLNEMFFLNQGYQIIKLATNIVPTMNNQFALRFDDSPEALFRLICYKDYLDLAQLLIKLSQGTDVAHELEAWARSAMKDLIGKLKVGPVENEPVAELPVHLFEKYVLDLEETSFRKTVADVYSLDIPMTAHAYPYNRWPYWATFEFIMNNDKFELTEGIKNKSDYIKIIENNELLPVLRNGPETRNP